MQFERINKYFTKNRYRLLLVFILCFMILPAFFPDSFLGRLIMALSFSFMLFQSVFVYVANPKRRWIINSVAFVALILTWYTNLLTSAHVASKFAQLIILIIFFIFVMLALFKIIHNARKITVDIIIVAISNYFIVAIVAGSLCYLSYLAEPETAFRLPQDIEPIDIGDFIYFAFVTLATLGYGDISPSNKETMTLSALIAVTGQFYVAVLVAFLVSKLEQNREEKNLAKE